MYYGINIFLYRFSNKKESIQRTRVEGESKGAGYFIVSFQNFGNLFIHHKIGSRSERRDETFSFH